MKAFLWGVIFTLCMAVLAACLLIYTAVIPVAASKTESPMLAWLMHTTYERRLASQAKEINLPSDLDSKKRQLAGARSFDEMCSTCHTPPSQMPTVVAQGLNPSPPKLADLMPHRAPAEAFWVIKNGVKMTGMPGFGATHSDNSLWDLVGFIRIARNLDENSYEQIIKEANLVITNHDEHDHKHGGSAHSQSMSNTDSVNSGKHSNHNEQHHEHKAHDL